MPTRLLLSRSYVRRSASEPAPTMATTSVKRPLRASRRTLLTSTARPRDASTKLEASQTATAPGDTVPSTPLAPPMTSTPPTNSRKRVR